MTVFRHFGIVVRDLPRMLAFYEQELGFHVVRRADEKGPFLDCIIGRPGTRVTTVKLGVGNDNIVLELLKFDAPAPEADFRAPTLFQPGPTHFALTVDDVGALHGRLAAAGCRATTPPLVSPDGKAKVTFCFDPEGNPIELVQPL
jgi:catechol 2,3-dioxygenase-like lactoylglutathione lyase family enzyme